MSKFIACLIFLSSSVLALQAQTNKKVVDGLPAELKLAELWVNELHDYYRIPGIAIGVISDQQLVYARGFGVADLESGTDITSKTLFRMASITKLFTSTAVMQLRDRGLLRLDDPVKKYLSWFEIKNPHEGSPPVTIRHLLTHTSGMPRESAFPYWTDRNFPTREELRNALPDQVKIFPSETKWKYSNLGMALLGELVEAVSGVAYDKYVKENILDPLGMADTRIFLSPQDKALLATGYLRHIHDAERLTAPYTASKGLAAAANISSNIKDMARFCALQFQYDQSSADAVVKGSTLKEMHRVQWLRPGWKSGWGLGFGISKLEDLTVAGHGGWVAGYRSHLIFSPVKKIGVIVMINTEDFSPYSIASRILQLAISAYSDDQHKWSGVPADDWSAYAGKYSDNSFWQTDVLTLGDRLYLYDYAYPPKDDPEKNLRRLYPEENSNFRLSGPGGNGEPVVFETNADGRVRRIKIGENYISPLR